MISLFNYLACINFIYTCTGDAAIVSADSHPDSPHLLSCDITSDQTAFQKEVTVSVSSTDCDCSAPPASVDVIQLDIAEHNGITIRYSSITSTRSESDLSVRLNNNCST